MRLKYYLPNFVILVITLLKKKDYGHTFVEKWLLRAWGNKKYSGVRSLLEQKLDKASRKKNGELMRVFKSARNAFKNTPVSPQPDIVLWS